ncbi:hypothetical protein MHBO_002100 [Bonamia ostreae]|uniref:YjeF C-terminal domain-containing protein n=1 Tax=Bonamia ostreae TaxID=126728 RepID=A0ABV2AL90_9EUKA
MRRVKDCVRTHSVLDHKGCSGRVTIIGGSPVYTGAPYFAGMAALRMGADLVKIICHGDAAIPIKSYSPELMVEPILSEHAKKEDFHDSLKNQHCVVVGPGLGRNQNIQKLCCQLIRHCCDDLKIPVVVDGVFIDIEKGRDISSRRFE